MKKRASRMSGVCGVVSILAMVMVMSACEKTERARALLVTPDTSSVAAAGEQVLLTASLEGATPTSITNEPNELLYPLVWSVSRPEYGTIVSAAGATAVYRCDTRHSRNVITVRDQAMREGMAIVEWEDTPDDAL